MERKGGLCGGHTRKGRRGTGDQKTRGSQEGQSGAEPPRGSEGLHGAAAREAPPHDGSGSPEVWLKDRTLSTAQLQ